MMCLKLKVIKHVQEKIHSSLFVQRIEGRLWTAGDEIYCKYKIMHIKACIDMFLFKNRKMYKIKSITKPNFMTTVSNETELLSWLMLNL